MRAVTLSGLLGFAVALAGCSGDGDSDFAASGGAETGGALSTGGASATGGAAGTGGASASGGTATTGGSSATGGASTTGGASATGGAAGTGGAELPAPCTTRTLQGEPDAADAAAAANCDAFWFAGYESTPWETAWALRWGPSPAGNHALSSDDTVLFGSSSARVTYHAPGTGPEDKDGFGPDDGVQYQMGFEELVPPVAARDSAFLRYYVRFDPGFDFVLGGKLPGLIGGEANTGGDVPDGTDGFSARIMWRSGGKVVQYVYHPEIAGYGEDMDWDLGGQRYFAPGKWHCVETEVVMNTLGAGVGNHDGVIRSWFDGELALERTDLRFRDVDTLAIDGIYFSTFFGGSSSDWAPAAQQHAQFDNFVLSGSRVGCCLECDLGDYTPVSPQPELSVTSSELAYDGDSAAWSTGSWNNAGTYDFSSTAANHSATGSHSAHIVFAPAEWDAAYLERAAALGAADRTHLRFWVLPSSGEVEFRVQLRGGTVSQSADVVVSGSPAWFAAGWVVGEWNEVIIPLADFDLSGATYDAIYFRSNTGTDDPSARPGFSVDDVELVTATEL